MRGRGVDTGINKILAELDALEIQLEEVKRQRDHYRKALEEVVHSNRTKTGMKEFARKALYDQPTRSNDDDV